MKKIKSKPKVTLYYRWCSIDRWHQYQVVFSDEYYSLWDMWVAFLIGENRKIIFGKKHLLFYKYDPTRKLAEYRGNDAERVAGYIVRKISKHYQEKIKKDK